MLGSIWTEWSSVHFGCDTLTKTDIIEIGVKKNAIHSSMTSTFSNGYLFVIKF